MSTRNTTLSAHLKRTFLAGIFAFVPVVVTIWIVWQVELTTGEITRALTGRYVPLVGIIICVAAIYLGGLLATSLLGKWALSFIDRLLLRVPVLKEAYSAWKQVALTPEGTEGTYSKVCLVPDDTGMMLSLGFTSGTGIPGDADTLAVFVPSVPNPIAGRMFFVPRSKVRIVDVTVEDAFKFLLSNGNFVPDGIAEATCQPSPAPHTTAAISTVQSTVV